MDGHALQCGGVIVDGGTFDWEKSGKFPDFTEPDESYHGVVYTREFGKMAYIIKARMQLMRDFGCYPAAHSAFLLNLGLETLPVRMKQYCENAMTVAKMLKESDKIASVTYPGLPDDPYHKLAEKYLPDGTCGVISISIKGGRRGSRPVYGCAPAGVHRGTRGRHPHLRAAPRHRRLTASSPRNS